MVLVYQESKIKQLEQKVKLYRKEQGTEEGEIPSYT